MGLNGIDISSWQDDLVVSNMSTCDFIIVKATGGAGYKDECFERHARRLAEALRRGRRLRWHEGGGCRDHLKGERGGADHGAPLLLP